jgi:hypothetical protein
MEQIEELLKQVAAALRGDDAITETATEVTLHIGGMVGDTEEKSLCYGWQVKGLIKAVQVQTEAIRIVASAIKSLGKRVADLERKG